MLASFKVKPKLVPQWKLQNKILKIYCVIFLLLCHSGFTSLVVGLHLLVNIFKGYKLFYFTITLFTWTIQLDDSLFGWQYFATIEVLGDTWAYSVGLSGAAGTRTTSPADRIHWCTAVHNHMYRRQRYQLTICNITSKTYCSAKPEDSICLLVK